MKTLIKNALVIDPKNGINTQLNILIEDGKIAAVTRNFPEADEVIDAEGLVAAPGFIDLHMHEDPVVDGKIDNCIFNYMLKMGVTTCVAGNCGDNEGNPADYLDIIDRDGLPCNVAMFAGHIWYRYAAGCTDKYAPATSEQLEKMLSMMKEDLSKGLVGVSFGVRYAPGCTREEVKAAAALCRKDDKLVAAHVRDDAAMVFESTDEFLAIAEELGLSAEVSHIGSMAGFGQMKEFLRQIADYRMRGVRVLCDCYPYNAFCTGIGSTTYDDGWLERYHTDYSVLEVCSGKYQGQRCTKEIFDEVRRDAPGTLTVCHVMRDEDVEAALTDPGVMLASDGTLFDHKGHPRAAGAFPRFISEYVRKGKLSLYEAVRKMTVMPAEKLGLENKGCLSVGADADIILFDPETIADRATFAESGLPPVGIERVIISGKTALISGDIVNGTIGRSVRK